MEKIVHLKVEDVAQSHQNAHEKYEYYRRNLVAERTCKCAAAQYEVPPGKAVYPYHYHTMREESYYILSGKGLLKTPEGEREVLPGEFLFFPANEHGAHKLTNASADEMLVYLDFETDHDLDVSVYPETGKVGIWREGFDVLYTQGQEAGYYEGE